MKLINKDTLSPKQQEILRKVNEIEFREKCLDNNVCPDCGDDMTTVTKINKRNSPMYYSVDDTAYCVRCGETKGIAPCVIKTSVQGPRDLTDDWPHA